MGKLQRLEVENFKSYAGKQIVGPFDNFTCIIGPNGAGKSNMMDAISFVLGVQSKHLRSTNLKDLLFRKDSSSPPARKASVKLVYQLSYGELEGMEEGHEISFTRNISSAGASSYKLDGKDVTYDAYESLLQKIGVLVKARNFLVFQGDVEAVASKNPLELTKLLEQVSGSDVYAAEYEQLIRQKNESEENTMFCMQKKKMYATQCKEIKEQKEEAETFALKQTELKHARSEQILWQLWRIKSDMEEHQESVDSGRDELEVIKKTENEVDGEVQSGKMELAKISKLLTAAEKEFASKTKSLENITPKLLEARAKLKSLQKRLKEIVKREGNIAQDLKDQELNVSNLHAHLSSMKDKERGLRKQLETATASGVKMDRAKTEEYSLLREEVSRRTAASQADLLTLSLDLSSKVQHLERLEAQEASVAQELDAGAKLLADYNDRRTKLQEAVSSSRTELSNLEKQKSEMIENQRTSTSKLQRINAEMDEVVSKLRDVGDDRRRSKQEERINEAIESMQRIYKGVYGKLGDLCRPIQKKYSQAVSVAAGKQMDAIVVASRQVAADCITYLKDQRVGTCIFLPLDSLIVKPLTERIRTFGGKYRPCVDLIECEDLFKIAVSYAVGSTVVCDTLSEAQELCFTRNERVKTVTLKGQVISRSGAMTGGASAAMRSAGAADRWEEREIAQMRSKKVQLEKELADVNATQSTRQQIIDNENAARAISSRVQFSEADLKVTTEKLKSLTQQQKLREKTQQSLKAEITSLSTEIESLKEKQAQADSLTRAVETEVFSVFSASVGVENIREYEEKCLKQHQDLMNHLGNIVKQSAALTAQLEYETKRDFQSVLTQVQLQHTEAEEEINRLEHEEQSLLYKEADARDKVQQAAERVAIQREARTAAVQGIKELQGRLQELQSDSSSLLKKLAGDEMSIERGRAQLNDVLRKAQMDEVSLPAVPVAAAGPSSSTSNSASSRRGSRVGTSSEESEETGSDSASVAEAGSSSNERLSVDYDKELEWRGSLSQAFGGDTSGSGSISGSNSGSGVTGSRDSGSKHFSQSDSAAVLRDSARASRVDLSSMNKYKSWSKGKLLEKERDIEDRIARLVGELEHITPNMHAGERYEAVLGKLNECNAELETLKDTARSFGSRFEDVRRQRQQLFSECFTHVCEALGVIYRDLTRSSKHPLGGNAYLTVDNTEEPYLSGTRFTAMPPMKRFRDMDQLSGGEKTMAALSMLFSIHSYRQAPFFVLDEVDAALDNVNVKKICNYIKHRSGDFQCIVISLKEMFFEHADCLVGICKDVEELSSKILTLDLSQFADGGGSSSGAGAAAAPDDDDASVAAGAVGGGGGGGTSRRSSSSSSSGRTPQGTLATGSTPGSGGSSGSNLGKRTRVKGAPPAIEEESGEEGDEE